MSTSRPRLSSVGIPFAVWLLSVIVADGAFRLVGDRPSLDLLGLHVSFGDSGFKLASNVHTWADYYSGRMDVYTDDLGLRCGVDPRTRTTAGSTIDVLYLGDSQGFGHPLNYEETIIGQLSKRGHAHGLRMASASVGGHWLANQFELAKWLHERAGIKIKRIVILATPLIVGTAEGYNQVSVGPDGRLYDTQPSPLRALTLWAKTHTVVYTRVREAYRQTLGLQAELAARLGLIVDRPVPVGIRLYESERRLEERRVALVRQLGEIRDWARSLGAQVDVAYLPLVTEMDFDATQDLARQSGIRIDVDVPLRLSQQAAAELGLRFLSARPALAAMQRAGEPLSVEADPHYSAETSAAVAELVWEFLVRAG